MPDLRNEIAGISMSSLGPDQPVDVPLKEKDVEKVTSQASRTEVGGDDLPDQQSADVTRRNSLASLGNASEHESPKALEAGFAGVREKGGVMIVDWDGPEDPFNPLK